MFDAKGRPTMLPDTQSQPDPRQVPIPAVGVAPVRLPLRYRDEETGITVPVDAEVGLYTDLAADTRGTHMSRLVDVLMEGTNEPITATALFHWIQQAVGLLGASTGQIAVRFRYHIDKAAPVTGRHAYVPYDVELRAKVAGRSKQLGWRVVVPVTTLCPCSKDIADYGAHNQRGRVTVTGAFRSVKRYPSLSGFLLDVEHLGSCPLYTLLKRPDEKWVTEAAYTHPKFVEDVLRDAVLWLHGRVDLSWFSVHVANDESIHPHNAVAYYDAAWVEGGAARPEIWQWTPWD
jgi:GTP cyclohydrolase I